MSVFTYDERSAMSDIRDGIGIAKVLSLFAGLRVCLRDDLRLSWAQRFDSKRCACAT